jgi:outer membrane protein assembly factor BamB/predicted phosphodiesterase
MRRRKFLTVVFALLLPCWLSAAPASFRFAWLSDTHIGSQTAADDLRAAVHDINSLPGLSFVLVSGDLTEYGSLEHLSLARAILGELRIPCYVLPGNHDTKWSESGATDVARLWKADRFVFDHGGYRFIGLHQGPLMKMGDGHWAPQDVRWLEQTLKQLRRPNQPIIFVTHYPIDNGIANWFVVLDELKRHNVQVVLCGHGHSNRKLSFEGVPGVMGRSNLRARNEVGGYNLVEINDGTITFSERVTGRETKPAWHSLALGPRDYTSDTNRYPRPDFSVNARYPEVRPRWTFNTGYTIASSPAVWSNLAVVGDASGTICALDLGTGDPVWKYRTRGAVYSTPAVAGDLVIAPSTDGTVYALRAASGKVAWRRKTSRPIVASPAVSDGVVYLGSSEGRFRALDAASGRTRWEFDGVRGFVETRPLLYEGKVIFGAWDQHLYALDAQTGQLAWKWKGDKAGDLLSPAACWPVGAAGKVFIVAPDRQMTAIDVRNGRQIWRTGQYVVRESLGLSEDGSRLYVRAMNDFFYAFATDAAAPTPLWQQNAGFGYDINSAMLVEKDGTVFYGTKNGLLFALDGRTGGIRWQHKLGVGIVNTLVPLGPDRVLATDFDGRVALIERTP